jgi:hypothetical protein
MPETHRFCWKLQSVGSRAAILVINVLLIVIFAGCLIFFLSYSESSSPAEKWHKFQIGYPTLALDGIILIHTGSDEGSRDREFQLIRRPDGWISPPEAAMNHLTPKSDGVNLATNRTRATKNGWVWWNVPVK